MVLVSYDVSTTTAAGRRRLRHVAKVCSDYGVRVQNSVFECVVDPGQWTQLKHKLLHVFRDDEDSLRFYFLGKHWRAKVEHHGIKHVLSVEDPLVI